MDIRGLAGRVVQVMMSSGQIFWSSSTSVLSVFLGSIFMAFLAILSIGFSIVIFLTCLFYLLKSKDDVLVMLAAALPFDGITRNKVITTLGSAISGVFLSALKVLDHHLTSLDYIPHIMFCFTVGILSRSADVAFLSNHRHPFCLSSIHHLRSLGHHAIRSVICCQHLCGTSLSLSHTLHLISEQFGFKAISLWSNGTWIAGIALIFLHFSAYFFIDTAIYSEIPNAHPYLVGLSIISGVYAFQLQVCHFH
jgi:hypothetical protein